MLTFVPLILSALLVAPATSPMSEAALLDAPTRHIRANDAQMHALLTTGFRKSPTFAALVRRIQRSDVIVYVEEVPRLPGGLEGRLLMQPAAHEHRYVRIQIALRGAPEDSVAVLGHELEHAVEIVEAADVRDQDGMVRLYERIGMRGGVHIYDT